MISSHHQRERERKRKWEQLNKRALYDLGRIIWSQTDLGCKSSSPGIRQLGIVVKQVSSETTVARFDSTTYLAVFSWEGY